MPLPRPSLLLVCARVRSATAFDFPTKGILQEAVQRKEYWRLVDAQVSAAICLRNVMRSGALFAGLRLPERA